MASIPMCERQANYMLGRMNLSKCVVGGKAWKDKLKKVDTIQRIAALHGWQLDSEILEPTLRIIKNRQEIHDLKQQLGAMK